jgi:hypothetical protein
MPNRTQLGCRAFLLAGSYSRALLDGAEAAGSGLSAAPVAAGVAFTALALAYIGRLAKAALDDIEEDS